MRILCSSDIHDDSNAFIKFSQILESTDHDIGIIAGDLTDYGLTSTQMKEVPGVNHDDLLEELYEPDDTIDDLFVRMEQFLKSKDTPFAKAMRYKESYYKKILSRSKKPVLLIPGNHDVTNWRSTKYVINIHNKAFDCLGYRFIGYRYTNLDRQLFQESKDVQRIGKLVVPKTVFVSHAPPYGILDSNFRGVNCGSTELLKIHNNPDVILHLFGHIHNMFGIQGKAINASFEEHRKFVSYDLSTGNAVYI